MRNIDFLNWGGENFCNFIEPVEMKTDNGKLTLICGPNGIGKTTLFEILSYALYGVTSKGLKAEDVLNERTLQNCSAWANFEISGEKYRVERYIKHKKFKNNVILYKAEQEIKVGANEVKAEIDRIFMSHKLFMNILFFSQKVKSFFTELPDSDQKEIFRKVLGLDDYLLYHKEISKRFDLAEIEVNKVKNNQIITTKLIEDCISNIDKLKELKQNFYIQKEKDIQHILSLKMVQYSKLKELEDNLSLFSEIQLRKDLEIISRKISEIQLKHELVNRECQNEINEISSKKATKRAELETEKSRREKTEIEKVNTARNSMTEKFNELKLSINKEISEWNQKVSAIQSKIDSSLVMKPVHQKEIKEITENVIDKQICYTCHQEISEEIKTQLKSKIEHLKSEISLIDQHAEVWASEIKLIHKKKEEISKAFLQENAKFSQSIELINIEHKQTTEDLNLKLKTILLKLDEAAKRQTEDVQLKMLNKKAEIPLPDSFLKEKEVIEKNLKDIKELESRINGVKSDIASQDKLLEYKRQEEFDGGQITSNEQRVITLNTDLAKLSAELIALEVRMRRQLFIKKMFSSTGIPSMLIDDSVPFINETVSKYLEQISGGRYIVSFDTVRETKGGDLRDKIGINVLDTVTLASSRAKLSGGQTRIIDIATILTLASLQSVMRDVKINLMLFDEIFDSLDDNNITYVARVLKTVTTDKAIFIISHRHIDLIEADEVIRLEG